MAKDRQGFLPIGRLANEITGSAKGTGLAQSKSPTSPSHSASVHALSIHIPLGMSGSAMPATILSEVQRAIESAHTFAVQTAIGRLLELVEGIEATFSPDWTLTGYRTVKRLDAVTRAYLAELATILLRPATLQEIMECIQKTWELGAKNVSGADLKRYTHAMSYELIEYPIDLISNAFREWRKEVKWLPAYADIVKLCEPEMIWRRSLRRLSV